jgi:hypothetical protein
VTATTQGDPATPPASDAPRKKWLGLARDIGIGVAIVLGVQWWRGLGVASEGLPDVTLTLLDGSEVALSGPRERPLLVQMEASWCGVCRMEDATIRELAEDHRYVRDALEHPLAQQPARERARDMSCPLAGRVRCPLQLASHVHLVTIATSSQLHEGVGLLAQQVRM